MWLRMRYQYAAAEFKQLTYSVKEKKGSQILAETLAQKYLEG